MAPQAQNTRAKDGYEMIIMKYSRGIDVGMERRLFAFIHYSPQELADTPDYDPQFRPGDVLAKLRKKKLLGPDEIIVVRLEDDLVDSVWPEEVEQLQ